jgi:hypothetical protein
MRNLLKEHGWLAIPVALVIFGAAAAFGGSGHDHGGTPAGHSPSELHDHPQ